MLCGFENSFISPVLQEEQLKKKICHLQSKMLDFHKRMSPGKENGIIGVQNRTSFIEAVVSTVIHWITVITKGFLLLVGCAACVAWPLCFPAFVYLGEGMTLFFWQIGIVSLLIAIAMTIKMASDIRETFKHATKSIRKIAMSFFNDLSEKSTNLLTTVFKTQNCKFSKLELKNMNHRITKIPVLACGIFALWFLVPLQEVVPEIYLVLLVAGFLTGIASSIFWNSSHKVVLPLIYVTDECNADEQRFSNSDCCRLSSNSSYEPDFTDTASTRTLVFPRTPPPTYQEAVSESIKSPACRMLHFSETRLPYLSLS